MKHHASMKHSKQWTCKGITWYKDFAMCSTGGTCNRDILLWWTTELRSLERSPALWENVCCTMECNWMDTDICCHKTKYTSEARWWCYPHQWIPLPGRWLKSIDFAWSFLVLTKAKINAWNANRKCDRVSIFISNVYVLTCVLWTSLIKVYRAFCYSTKHQSSYCHILFAARKFTMEMQWHRIRS